ncbi:MAG: DUF2786 domain-containing protein [Deltaproteobacteria bacterium]|nr:DUF2786 domain-containing protein [Deltaproteobacteria bacterium]
MKHASVIERVRKLLRLAQGTGNEHEAHVAAAMAQRLIDRHGLMSVDLEEHADEGALDGTNPRTIYGPAGRIETWIKELGHQLGRLCGCYTWHSSTGSRSWSIVAVGRERDLETFAVLFECLRETMLAVWRRMPAARRRPLSRASFLRGLGYGVVKRMEVAQNEVCREARASSRTALLPVDRAKAAEAAVRALHHLRSGRSPALDNRSLVTGYRRAAQVKVPGEHAALTGQQALAEGGAQ